MAVMYDADNEHVYIQITSETPNVEEHKAVLKGYVYRYSSSGGIMTYTGNIGISGTLTTNDGSINVNWSGRFPNTSQIGAGDFTLIVNYPSGSTSQSLSGSLLLYIHPQNSASWISYGSAMAVNWTLKKIPLNVTAPTLSASSVNFNSSVNVVTSDPDNASLKYDITYAFGSATGSIGTNLSAGTKAWTVPNSLMAQIPSATSGVIKINVTAKSEAGEELASWQLDLTANVPTSVVPTISALTVAEAATIPSALSGLYIQSKSKFTVTGTAAGAQGSTISKYSTTVDGATYSGATFTSNFIKSSGTVAVKMTVTDSRGRTASKTTNVTVQAYTPPTISAVSAYRCTSSTSSTAKPDGGYICVKPTGSVTSLSSKNTKACKIYYKKSSASSYTATNLSVDYTLDTEFGIFTADINSSYDVYVTLQDAFSTTTFYCPQVSSGGAYIHIPPDRSGMGLGKMREASGNIETAWNIKANGDITADADGRPISLQTAGVKQYNFYSARPTTVDMAHSSDGSMVHAVVGSAASDRPETTDGHLLHFNWDNTGEWDAELYLSNSNGRIWTRSKNGSTKVWNSWYEVVTTNNIERLVMTSSSADIAFVNITGITWDTTTRHKVSRTGKIAMISLQMKASARSGSTTYSSGTTTIATIPAGYRPAIEFAAGEYIFKTDGSVVNGAALNTQYETTSKLDYLSVMYICA
jgi:hypothetical protein